MSEDREIFDNTGKKRMFAEARKLNAQSQEPSEGKREAPHPRNTSVGLFPEPSAATSSVVTISRECAERSLDRAVIDTSREYHEGIYKPAEKDVKELKQAMGAGK